MARWKKKQILAKIESVYGTDSTPTGAANAMLVRDLELQPMVANQVQRNTERPTFGAEPTLQYGERGVLTFMVEAQGAGAAGTAAAYGPLLRGSGLDQTINAGVSVVHEPISASEESVTIHWHGDGTRHKFVGSLGDVGFRAVRGEIPYWMFQFTGLYVDPGDVADPTPVWSGFIAPLIVNKANTPTFTLHGYAAVLHTLEWRLNNVLSYRNLVNQEKIILTDRSVSGRVIIEAPLLATKDYFAIAKAGTTGAMQLIHGSVAGRIVQIDAARTEIRLPRYIDDDGIRMLEAQINLLPSDTGDDDVTITLK